MAGVEDVPGSPVSLCWNLELDAVPVTVPSSVGSWVRVAQSCNMCWDTAQGKPLPCQCGVCRFRPLSSAWTGSAILLELLGPGHAQNGTSRAM